MVSGEDMVNGKERCYFQEKKCLTDIHNRTAIASKYVFLLEYSGIGTCNFRISRRRDKLWEMK